MLRQCRRSDPGYDTILPLRPRAKTSCCASTALPVPTGPDMRVHVSRLQMPALSTLTVTALVKVTHSPAA